MVQAGSTPDKQQLGIAAPRDAISRSDRPRGAAERVRSARARRNNGGSCPPPSINKKAVDMLWKGPERRNEGEGLPAVVVGTWEGPLEGNVNAGVNPLHTLFGPPAREGTARHE